MEKKTAVCGRFAPSPSGRMHMGNLWSCLLAWLSARSAGGRMVLRLEDLDPDRCRPESVSYTHLHGTHLRADGGLAGGDRRGIPRRLL